MPLLSVQRIVEISAVGIAATLFIPGPRALPDKFDQPVPFLLWQWARQVHGLQFIRDSHALFLSPDQCLMFFFAA